MLASQKHFAKTASRLVDIAVNHACSSHELFEYLETCQLNNKQVAALLRNYDAHASVLRRLLLRAAAIMPEEAVTFVLENVRNEYGNGNYELNHQRQLRDLCFACGVSSSEFHAVKIQAGVKSFIKQANRFYRPGKHAPKMMKTAAITAGAITATELLAIKEFTYMQKAFEKRKMQHHIWFHHVNVEAEHSEESLALAGIFAGENLRALEYGLNGVLDANIRLYDGLLSAMLNVQN